MLSVAEKAEIVKKFGKTEKDTGSAEVQIAILTKRINGLIDHFKEHKHDFHSRRGLMKMIGQRKSFLSYLAKKDSPRYQTLIKELNLRK